MPDQTSPAFHHSTRQLLRPIVRLLLKNGVDLATFMAEVRNLYVEVAQEKDFAVSSADGREKKITISRIAVLTGINRKEVKRIIDAKDDQSESYLAYANRAIRVINGWMQDKRFTDQHGEPYSLSVGKPAGEHRFEDLVKAYSGDITARVILDELVRVGSVNKEKNGKITLVGKGYVPSKCDDEIYAIGSAAIRDMVNTVAHNIGCTENGSPHLQLSVEYDDVPVERVSLFRSLVSENARDFIAAQNRIISNLDREKTPEPHGTGRVRIGVGLYMFEELLND